MDNRPYIAFSFRFLFIAAALFLLYAAGRWALIVLLPFLFSWIVAILINPVVLLLERRVRVPRWFASLLLVVLVFMLIMFFLFIAFEFAMEEISLLAGELTKALLQLPERVNALVQNLTIENKLDQGESDAFSAGLEQSLTQLAGRLSDLVNTGSNLVLNQVGAIPKYAFITLIVVLATYFISKELPKMAEWYRVSFLPRQSTYTRTVIQQLQQSVFGYFKAQLILIAITGCIVSIGLSIIGLDRPVLIGLASASLDIIPTLGVGTVFVPWIIWLLLTQNTTLAIQIAILYAISSTVRQLAEPRITGRQIGIHPLLFLVAMYAGFQTFGVSGLIIGPVIAVILQGLIQVGFIYLVWQWLTEPLKAKKSPVQKAD